MESINLGAVLFALLLLLWLAYALPRTASRREVMGRARAAEQAEMSSQARDLSAAVRSRRSPAEMRPAMSQDRVMLRPVDPTARPRFDAEPGIRVDLEGERARSRRLLSVVLAVLVLSVIGLTIAAVLGPVPWWAPLAGLAVLGVYLIGLRRAELRRRALATRAATRVRRERAERETARRRAESQAAARTTGASARIDATDTPTERTDLDQTTERARAQMERPGEWTPRPVPRPTYALRGEVDDLASRHAAHRQSMLRSGIPLEAENVEELEATSESLPAALDLRLDEILERRRA